MVDYTPLYKTLIDKKITKTKLREEIGFSSATLAKISKNEYISLRIIDSICKYLECEIQDVIKIN